jgi:hypothetical protein
MGSAKTALTPAVITICLIILVEFSAPYVSATSLLSTGIARIFEIFIMIGVYHQTAKGVSALGLSSVNIRHGVIQGILWSMAFALIAGLFGIAMAAFGFNPFNLIRITLPDTAGQIAFFYLVGGIVGPVAEEMFFRGLIYGHIRDQFSERFLYLGVITGLVISTLLFVMAHRSITGVPLPQLIGGIVFCLSYEKEKSLFTPIIIHISGNMAIFTLALTGS